MKRSQHIRSGITALTAAVLLFTLNLIVAVFNDHSGTTLYGTGAVLETIPLHFIFACLYWLTCAWRIPIRP